MAEGNPTCSICLETFKDPVTIPCNHVFCSGCINRHKEKNARDGSFTCPLCNRVVISCGKEQDTDQRIVSKEEISAKCDVCGPNMSATSRCFECVENYCQVCSATHIKMKASRNHTLYELGVLDPPKNVTLHRREFCTKHPEEEIKIVCQTCRNRPLCIFCKVSEHDNHTSRILAEELAEELAKVKNTLEKTMTLCPVRLEQLQSCMKEAEAFDSEIYKFEQEEYLSINKQEQELISLLEETKYNIKQEARQFRESIRLMYEKIRMENNVCKKQLAKEFSDCVAVNTEARKLTDIEKESHVIQRGWQLNEDFEEESKRTGKIKLLGMRGKAFFPAQRSMPNFKLTMGEISTDIMKERKMNIFLKSCVKGEPLHLLEVQENNKISELRKLVTEKYSLLPRTNLVLKFDGRILFDSTVGSSIRLLQKDSLGRYGITNGSIIECVWGNYLETAYEQKGRSDRKVNKW